MVARCSSQLFSYSYQCLTVFSQSQPERTPGKQRKRSAEMCGGFYGILVEMFPGASPKNSCPGFQREDLFFHTTESYGEQPKWWLTNVIKSSSIYLFSHTQCHFFLILWSQDDSGRFSHHIKLQRKPVSFLVFHLIGEKTFHQRPLATFYSHFIGQNWASCLP